jgi:hypothetical protein
MVHLYNSENTARIPMERIKVQNVIRIEHTQHENSQSQNETDHWDDGIFNHSILP